MISRLFKPIGLALGLFGWISTIFHIHYTPPIDIEIVQVLSNSQATHRQPTDNPQPTPTDTPKPTPTEYPLQGDFDIYFNNMYVPCKIGKTDYEIQSITNGYYAGAWSNHNILYVYDHVNQVFSGLKTVKIDDIIKVKTPQGVAEYKCYLVQRKMNGNIYNYVEQAERTGCKIMLQTCDPHYPSVMYVYFR